MNMCRRRFLALVNGRLLELDPSCSHGAYLCEMRRVAAAVNGFLAGAR